MLLPAHSHRSTLLIFLLVTIINRIPSGAAIVNNITIDYVKVGSCNSSIVVRVGDFCDYIVTIIIPNSGSGNASTDLSVEIIMPDNDTMVMQMSKPQITHVGGNFLNPSNLYDPAITMTSQLNTSQFDDARIEFGNVVNGGLVSPGNANHSSIMISFRSIVISNPLYQTNGSQYWVTVGIEYNNVTEIWIGQALFIFSNSSAPTVGALVLDAAVNSTSQIPQGSPFQLRVPVNYNNTFASNFVFTVTNNNPSDLGLCAAYVQDATSGFSHLPTLGFEISSTMTFATTNNQIAIRLGQIVNTQSYTGSTSTLFIVVYGRIFKRDGISSYAAGTMTATVNATGSAGSTQAYTIFAIPAVTPSAVNGSIPTFTITPISTPIAIFQPLRMTVTMTVPVGFSAPVVFDLNGSSNTSTPVLRACSITFQSAGENVAGSGPQCMDTNIARRTYASSANSSDYDQLSYDYGVISNTGPRLTNYADSVNTIVFDAIFQLMNTSQSIVWPAISVSLGNNTIWLGSAAVNVSTMSLNATNATAPTFQLSYDNNGTVNQSVTNLGETRLFYYDIFTKPNSIYTPMLLRITTNETIAGSGIMALSICAIRVLYVGPNVACLVSTAYNQPQSPFITYSSRINQRKNDTAMVRLGPLCNVATTQANDDLGRIRIGVYVRVEPALGNDQASYVNLDVFYTPSIFWLGQILFTGRDPGTPPTVVGTPLLFPLNSTTQSFFRNSLTVINYGLKIPPSSRGVYSELTSSVTNEANQQTSICRVDISPNRGTNVPCANDVSSVFTINTNGFSSSAVTNLGMVCSIGTNSSTVNSSLSLDADTLIIQVFLLATSQTATSFDLTLANLVPSGQSALTPITLSFSGGVLGSFGNISALNSLNATTHRQLNDTNNGSLAYLGQDVMIRVQFVMGNNTSNQACYPLMFQFGITAASIDAAYFTNGFLISTGDNFMCLKQRAAPILGSGSSTFYNASMYMDLGTLCYYPIDPLNVSASTVIVQANVRVPVTTTVPVNNAFTVNIAALLNLNQSSTNTSISFTVSNHTVYNAFTIFTNDSISASVTNANSTMSSSIRQMVTYGFRVYIPPYSQGRVQLTVQTTPVSGSVSVNLLSADILSAGINVGSFMFEYALGNRYQWAYSSSVAGSSYRDTAYLDLGVVTNTGASLMQQTSSNASDNTIFIQATGYLTDSPAAENNFPFTVSLTCFFGSANVSASYNHVVRRNGTEKPMMFLNHTDLTSGPYGPGSFYTGQVVYGHQNSSDAECINAQLIMYLPGWITLRTYNASSSATNYTTDNSSYVLFNLGTLFFPDSGSIAFTLDIAASDEMALAYSRYFSSKITIPMELMCGKRPRNNTAFFPASKIFAFPDTLSLNSAVTPVVLNFPSILNSLQSCQFTSSVPGSDASLVRTTGWQTGYRSNLWMLSGGTYLQINFGNTTLIDRIQLSVPGAFAPIRTVQLGFSWDGRSFAMDSVTHPMNGSSSYTISFSKPLSVGYLRIYVIDVMQPTDLLTSTSGFILNITGVMNSSNVTIADVCRNSSNALAPRTVLVAPSTAQPGLSYNNDVYVCDETPRRSSIQCFLLVNGDLSGSATWIALNSTVANIILFAFDPTEQIQSLYGYAQDGMSVLRSDDRGLTWFVTTPTEMVNTTSQCASIVKTCSTHDTYPIMSIPPSRFALQSGVINWSVSVRGVWTQQVGGLLAFDWFGH